ncbi:MAG: 4'-phosphopantetheinyl transferase family protein [Solirubrobacterales bacterium]
MTTSIPAWPDVLAQDPFPQWAPAPTRPRLTEGETHVWRADTTSAAEHLAQSQGTTPLLSDDELARGELISGEQQRARWLGAHALLRILLGRYLDCAPGDLQFATGEHGKPSLAPTFAPASAEGPRARDDGATLHFNLSHSAGTVLYAFSADAPVGVDVEVAERERDYASIVRRVFGEGEAERLRQLDRATRELEFLRAWSRWEAEVKCLGTGLGWADADEVTDGRRAGTTAHAANRQALAPHAAGPIWIAELELGPRTAGAVASLRRPEALRCWTWDWAVAPMSSAARKLRGSGPARR